MEQTGVSANLKCSHGFQEWDELQVKCTDNDLYRVNPVYAFIEPGQTVSFDIVRNNGGNKNDKLVFLATKVSTCWFSHFIQLKPIAKKRLSRLQSFLWISFSAEFIWIFAVSPESSVFIWPIANKAVLAKSDITAVVLCHGSSSRKCCSLTAEAIFSGQQQRYTTEGTFQAGCQ